LKFERERERERERKREREREKEKRRDAFHGTVHTLLQKKINNQKGTCIINYNQDAQTIAFQTGAF